MNPADRKRVWTAFSNLRFLLSAKYPYLSEIELAPCKTADWEHSESSRQYAHVLHVDGAICVANDIWRLSRGNLYGVLLHEFGHLIVERESGGNVPEDEQENSADEAIARMFGFDIRYDAGQPTVEWADPGIVEREIMDAKLQ